MQGKRRGIVSERAPFVKVGGSPARTSDNIVRVHRCSPCRAPCSTWADHRLRPGAPPGAARLALQGLGASTRAQVSACALEGIFARATCRPGSRALSEQKGAARACMHQNLCARHELALVVRRGAATCLGFWCGHCPASRSGLDLRCRAASFERLKQSQQKAPLKEFDGGHCVRKRRGAITTASTVQQRFACRA